MDRARNVEHLVQKRKPRAGTTEEPSQPEPAPREASDLLPPHLLSPEELYRRERARRGHARSQNDALAAAREAYHALLREEAASGKGGRPRSKPAAAAKPAPADDLDVELHDEHGEVPEGVHDEEVHLDEHEAAHDEEPHEIVAAAVPDEEEAAPAPAKRRGRPPAAKTAKRPAAKTAARGTARPAQLDSV